MGEGGGRCRQCGGMTERRYFAGGPASRGPAPASEITLPCDVVDARFMAGDAWTHGRLHLTDLGMYGLSETDGPWTPDKMLMLGVGDPEKPRTVAPSSWFMPLKWIQKFQHGRLTSFAMYTRDGRKPLRLTSEGWKVIDAFAAKLGIPSA